MNEQKKKVHNVRVIPTDEEWFNILKNHYSSWIYCYMYSSATFNTKESKLYYSKANLNNELKDIEKMLKITTRTVKNYINKLITQELISEDKEFYYFRGYVAGEPFIYINKDLLNRVCIDIECEDRVLLINVFVYLANRMKYKREVLKENTYNFTLKELRMAFGYKPSANAGIDAKLTNCLEKLQEANILSYTRANVNIFVNGHNQVTENHILTNFINVEAERKAEVPGATPGTAEPGKFVF